MNNLHSDTNSKQSAIWIFPIRTGQQPHLTPQLSSLTGILHLSPLHPAHWETCRASWAIQHLSQWLLFFFFFANITGHSSKELFYAFDLHYKRKGLSSMWPGKAASSERLWKRLLVESLKKEGKLLHNTVQNYFYENSVLYIWKL